MRLFCWFCLKSVSTDVDDSTIVRAVCVCPECVPRVIGDAEQLRPVEHAQLRDVDPERATRKQAP